MSSYVFSEYHNFQSILWTVAGAVGRTVRTIRQLSTMGLAASLAAYTLLCILWPDVVALGAAAAKVAGWVFVIAGSVAIVAFLPVELFVGLAIVGAYAVVMRPKGVRK